MNTATFDTLSAARSLEAAEHGLNPNRLKLS